MGSVDTATLELLAAWKAEDALTKPNALAILGEEIPGDLLARLLDLCNDAPLTAAVTVSFTTIRCRVPYRPAHARLRSPDIQRQSFPDQRPRSEDDSQAL